MKKRKVYVISLHGAVVAVCGNQTKAYNWFGANLPASIWVSFKSYSQFNRLINATGILKVFLDGTSCYTCQSFYVL
jgi:hypothetical protein